MMDKLESAVRAALGEFTTHHKPGDTLDLVPGVWLRWVDDITIEFSPGEGQDIQLWILEPNLN